MAESKDKSKEKENRLQTVPVTSSISEVRMYAQNYNVMRIMFSAMNDWAETEGKEMAEEGKCRHQIEDAMFDAMFPPVRDESEDT